MWSNAPLVLLSVRLGERFRLRLPLGLWAVSGLLLSLDGLLALVPGTWGGRLRPLSDGAYAFLRELQAQPPQELVNVRLRDREGPVQVSARTWGPLPAKKEGARPRRGMPWALCLPWELAACWLSLLLVGLLRFGIGRLSRLEDSSSPSLDSRLDATCIAHEICLYT